VVHDAAGSRVPWEALNIRGWVPALQGGLSRRYATADLVPARFDAERRSQRDLGVLLIANPTGDLPGAESERERLVKILSRNRSVRLTEVVGESATLARVTASSNRAVMTSSITRGMLRSTRIAPAIAGSCSPMANSRARIFPRSVACRRSSCSTRVNPLACSAEPVASEAARVREASPRTWGLAETLLRAGVARTTSARTGLSTMRRTGLRDRCSTGSSCARTFGTALVMARRAVLRGRSVDWADYVHYGDADSGSGSLRIFAAKSRAACVPPAGMRRRRQHTRRVGARARRARPLPCEFEPRHE
jgi:hypothetical protein